MIYLAQKKTLSDNTKWTSLTRAFCISQSQLLHLILGWRWRASQPWLRWYKCGVGRVRLSLSWTFARQIQRRGWRWMVHTLKSKVKFSQSQFLCLLVDNIDRNIITLYYKHLCVNFFNKKINDNFFLGLGSC